MHYVVSMDVIECPHQLVGIELNQEWMDLLPEFLEALLYAIDVGGYVIHHNMKFSIFSFTKVSVLDSDNILMMHFLMNLQLSALVLFILFQLLDCDYQAIAGKGAHIDSCKGSMTAFDLI